MIYTNENVGTNYCNGIGRNRLNRRGVGLVRGSIVRVIVIIVIYTVGRALRVVSGGLRLEHPNRTPELNVV